MFVFLGVLLLIGMAVGFYDSLHLRIVIEVNTFRTFYYNVGLSFYEGDDYIDEQTDEQISVKILTIGLFFINFVFLFNRIQE